MREVNAVIAIAFRDLTKLIRDRTRILANFIFPVIFIGVLGSSLQSNLQGALEYNFLTFVFTGVIGQTLFQSTASGIISLVEDRQNDFAQEMFVAPISRYSIIAGKIFGETMVSFVQVAAVIAFGFVIGVPINVAALIRVAPFFFLAAILGGSFGTLVMANLSNQKSASQIFPFLIFPQFFLAGVFNPIQNLPPILWVASRMVPMTYAVDLVRSFYYLGTLESADTVLFNPTINILVVSIMSLIFITLGTFFFVRKEKER